VLQLKKVAKGTKRNIEETIIIDAQGQPHSIFQKRILGET
jgi:hypothetical protein